MYLVSGAIAHADVFCTEPMTPVCLESGTNFDSTASRQRCISDLVTYQEKLEEYRHCLGRKIDETDALAKEAEDRKQELVSAVDE